MKNLDSEQYTVLLKRITKALELVKYEPATNKYPEEAAREILRPYYHPVIIIQQRIE